MKTYSIEYLTEISSRILQACSTPVDDAQKVAQFVVAANARGLDSHGIRRISQYVNQIGTGQIKPGASIDIERETSTSALLDINWNFGQLGADQASHMAIEKARNHGMGCVALHRCVHVGCVGLYAQMVADEGMVALAACSGAAPSGHWVAPWGGREGRIGTNPIAFAAPTSGDPILIDVATSTVSEGKVHLARDCGEQLPDHWLVDAQGKPSNNPNDLYSSPAGAIQCLGGMLGYKGYGFAVIAQVLSTILTRSSLRHVPEESNNFWLMAIDVSTFMDLDEFISDLEEFIAYSKSAKPAQGFSHIIMPGELDFRNQQVRTVEGVPVPDEIWREIEQVAQKLSVTL